MTLFNATKMEVSKNSRGVAAVEFALLLPLLLVLIFGGIEFGLLMYNKQVITNASREGARAGIVSQTPKVTAAEITTVVDNYAEDHLITFNAGGAEPTTTATWLTQGFGDDLTVTVTYPYTFLVVPNLLVTFFGGGLDGSLTLTARTVMKYE